MDLRPYVEDLRRQLLVAADAGGDDARAVAERLVAPLEAATRLALQDVLAAAADEITTELAPGSVELRLRGREPEFVVTPRPVDGVADDPYDDARRPSSASGAPLPAPADGDDATMTRINLRMSDQLKARVERAAAGEGLSVNAWLVRAASAALDRSDAASAPRRRAPHGAQRHTGWAR